MTDLEPYKEFLEIAKSLDDAKIPTKNRVMYYRIWSWWRHSIKRLRQIKALKRLESL